MPRKREPAEWELNLEFCTIASVAFWDDYARATAKIKVQANTRRAAADRMQLRYDGFVVSELLESKVRDLDKAVTAMGEHLRKQAKSARDAVRVRND